MKVLSAAEKRNLRQIRAEQMEKILENSATAGWAVVDYWGLYCSG